MNGLEGVGIDDFCYESIYGQASRLIWLRRDGNIHFGSIRDLQEAASVEPIHPNSMTQMLSESSDCEIPPSTSHRIHPP